VILKGNRLRNLRPSGWKPSGPTSGVPSDYSGKQKAPAWLTISKVLDLAKYGAGATAQAAAYRRELEAAATLGEFAMDWKTELKATLLLGPKEFVEKMKKLLKGDRREQTGLRKAKEGSVNWQQITLAVGELWRQDWETLRAGYGNGAVAAALYLGRNCSDKTLRELGELAGGMQYPAVTMAIRRFTKQLQSNRLLAKKMKHLELMLLVKT
jgi:hypothetical protein